MDHHTTGEWFIHGPTTVGSLTADILRYNADNLSITLKLWGKSDENVSWVNTFPSHSSISLHFTRQNIAHRVTTVPLFATASMLSTHIVLSRGNGCHKRATKLIPWGLRQFLRKLSISAGLSSIHDIFLFQLWSVSILCISEPLNCFHFATKLNFFCRWTQHWKCEIRFSLYLSFAGAIPRCKTQKTPRLISHKLEWAYCKHTYLEFLLSYPPSFRNFTDELFKLTSSCCRSYSLADRMSTVLQKFL